VRYDVLTGPIDARELEAAVSHPGAGAICTFTGIVRDNSRGQSVTHLDYEAYAEMAHARIEAIVAETIARHGLCAAAADHRIGRVALGEPSVVVAASAPHREAAFVGARELIDRIKAEAPIWKKEEGEWVAEHVPPVTPPADP
jgi:molybdopterin synthase catalytic subunit